MARKLRSNLKTLLSEPMYLLDYASEDDAVKELLRRMQQLFAIFEIEPTESNYKKLAWSLADAMLGGFKVKLMRRTKAILKHPGGHPALEIDLPELIVSIDRRIDEASAKGKKFQVSMICKLLVKTAAYKGYRPEQLANQYYKHAKSTQSSPNYFYLYPERACARVASKKCFALANFEDCDLGETPSLCKQQSGCRYLELTIELIRIALRQSSRLEQVNAQLQSVSTHLDKARSSVERVRRRAIAARCPRPPKSK